jgi:indole-3-glycerol phosphate synthase/phosphoribosylanthranilate isomerase
MADGVLGEIVAAKRVSLAARLDGVSLDSLRGTAKPTRRSLAAAIEQPGARFILEIKKASPSEGVIRRGADVAAIARAYRGVADALSVLIDGAFFAGSLADLSTARAAFDGPILAKDVFIDPRQVVEARIAGADAVLVMLSVLDDDGARAIVAEAARFGMDALVEVHDEVEMHRALDLGARLIGINNRDLRDLSVDLATTERLAGLAAGRTLISESGVSSGTDVERLAGLVDGFLVGSSLMHADDPGDAARALVFGRVKLCGLNRAEDFEQARAATHAGLIFVPESPRAISMSEALQLAGLGPKPVGVFRNAPAAEIAAAANLLGLAAVQLHGDEDDEYLRSLARKLPAVCEIWKAVRVADDPVRGFASADRLLFDSGSGGSGRTFDWSLVKDHPDLGRALVAGGIGPHNAPAAARLGAYGLDVGSAVDERPGVKSPAKIATLFDALRPTSRQELRECA